MAELSEVTVVDKIEILADGQLQVRRVNQILRDGVEIAATYHRAAYAPGAEIDNEDDRVKTIAAAVWTPAVVDAYKARVAAAEQELKRGGR